MQRNDELWWVNLDGTDYPARTLHLPNWGWSNISIESLNEKVLDEDGINWVSSEACHIDNQFLFYVPDNAIHWHEDKLANFILKELA